MLTPRQYCRPPSKLLYRVKNNFFLIAWLVVYPYVTASIKSYMDRKYMYKPRG